MRKKDSGTVIRMKFFPFISSLVIIHPTVSPDTVDIGKDQLYITHLQLYFEPEHLHKQPGGGNCEDKQH